jgi:YidC/Oxa1 family membrane protein insertase
MGNLFNLIFVNPLINALVAIYTLLVSLHIPYALGFSIILLTIVIRLLLSPFTLQQMTMTKKMQTLSPEMNRLKQKHKNDQKKLQEETMALYKKHGVNPMSGCLPTLVQFLLFPALYGVFQTFVGSDATQVMTKFNSVLYFDFLKLSTIVAPTFFGLPLGKSPSQLFAAAPLFLLIPIVTAFLQFLQSKMMFPKQQPALIDKHSEKQTPDFQTTFQSQIIYIIPLTIGLAAFNFPIGLALYWNTFTVFAMIQQYRFAGWGGLEEWIAKIFPTKTR